MSAIIQIRRDNTANWTGVNPVLAQGEMGLDLSVGAFKVGDGIAPWNSLPFFQNPNVSYTLIDAPTILVDGSQGNRLYTVTLTASRLLGNPTGTVGDGERLIFRVTQGAGGSKLLTYDTLYRFSTDLPSPILSTAAGKTDYLGFIYNAANSKWDFLALTRGFS
jgi:hypothetical protein